MITLEKFQHDAIRITGNGVEMLMFFVFWQSCLWPEWPTNIGKSYSLEMHDRNVVQAVRDAGEVLIRNKSRNEQEALAAATARCKAIGIEVVA